MRLSLTEGTAAAEWASEEQGWTSTYILLDDTLDQNKQGVDAFRAKDRLDAMRRSAMARSFSWDLSAACYSALYRKTIAPSIIA